MKTPALLVAALAAAALAAAPATAVATPGTTACDKGLWGDGGVTDPNEPLHRAAGG